MGAQGGYDVGRVSSKMNIVGISAYYHDSAISIIRDGKILFAAHEERYSRIKHDNGFPILALKAGLKQTGLTIDDIDFFVYYENPLHKALRLIKSAITTFPSGIQFYAGACTDWLRNKKLFVRHKIHSAIAREFGKGRRIHVVYGKHHYSHACAAFYPSTFEEAAVLCIDGVGEFDTCTIWHAADNIIKLKKRISFPNSVGLLYSAFTYYCGFKVNSGEYKLMGLAPYGEPRYYKRIIDNLFVGSHNNFRKLNMKYFCYDRNHIMINNNFINLFDQNGPRKPESKLTSHYLDVAASIQLVIEEVVRGLATEAKRITRSKNLCMSGGVALNCVSNGKLYSNEIFESIWIQPASGDAGSALGCALGYYHKAKPRRIDRTEEFNAYLGSSYTDSEVLRALNECNATYETFVNENELCETIAREIGRGHIVGWHQDRSEFGPRALGARSILADARNDDSQKRINLKIKKREGFRPFAPIVLREQASKYFEIKEEDCSPYMLFVYSINESIRKEVKTVPKEELFDRVNQCRSIIPAVTHIDYSARVQTVEEVSKVRIYNLLKEFFRQTGCAVLVNTSFNVRGEPIVETPIDAYRCFMNTDMDILVINNFVLRKELQPSINIARYKQSFAMD